MQRPDKPPRRPNDARLLLPTDRPTDRRPIWGSDTHLRSSSDTLHLRREKRGCRVEEEALALSSRAVRQRGPLPVRHVAARAYSSSFAYIPLLSYAPRPPVLIQLPPRVRPGADEGSFCVAAGWRGRRRRRRRDNMILSPLWASLSIPFVRRSEAMRYSHRRTLSLPIPKTTHPPFLYYPSG